MAALREGERSRLLMKIAGELEHGGGEVLKPDSTGHHVLERFVRRIEGKSSRSETLSGTTRYDASRFFADLQMLDDRRLLRRVTLSLAGRLPTDQEHAAVAADGAEAISNALNALMNEDAFYERLAEGFNDILLTRGYDGVPERALGYRNFSNTRGWNQKHDLSHIPEEKRQKARYKLADDYREAMLREPTELVKYIVRNERPVTELVTADYIMVSPYTARGYGVFDELKDKFQDSNDHLEFIPTKIPALTRNDGKPDQESATGFYPHSGLLTTFQYLKRYPTTETNRNRLRARMYFQHFLGIDIMELAPRVTDAAAVDAKYEIPTMQAADCVVCHKTIDPIAGLFQDFYDTGNDVGLYGPRKDGWFEDMFAPGLEPEQLPSEHRWRALQWLGERTAKDPRFAVAMVEHAYYILAGRKVLTPPQDIDDPNFTAHRRAYQAQRDEVEAIADRFANANFNLKAVFKELVMSPVYRVDGPATVTLHPQRAAELHDAGVIHLLTPEQLQRKISAVFGRPWDRFSEQLQMLYGGIDYKEVTERMAEPNGAMGAVQRIMANAVACRNVAADFALDPTERRLFPDIDPDVIPRANEADDRKVRDTIVHLHQHVLGRIDTFESEEVMRTFELFAGIIDDANAQDHFEPIESYFCRSVEADGPRDPDPHYTLRAWRGVLSYLLRREEFLYE
ncbi:MAG: DUF1549 domain-containing protein [Planctomycetes bacterium]|nr:DUF1549 domain-containing protein [Planctomycetota bacterium]